MQRLWRCPFITSFLVLYAWALWPHWKQRMRFRVCNEMKDGTELFLMEAHPFIQPSLADANKNKMDKVWILPLSFHNWENQECEEYYSRTYKDDENIEKCWFRKAGGLRACLRVETWVYRDGGVRTGLPRVLVSWEIGKNFLGGQERAYWWWEQLCKDAETCGSGLLSLPINSRSSTVALYGK